MNFHKFHELSNLNMKIPQVRLLPAIPFLDPNVSTWKLGPSSRQHPNFLIIPIYIFHIFTGNLAFFRNSIAIFKTTSDDA